VRIAPGVSVVNSVRQIWCYCRLGLVMAMLAISAILHYSGPEGILSLQPPGILSGLTQDFVGRVLLLSAAAYAGYVFGLVGGLATLSVAVAIALSAAILSSPISWDFVGLRS